MWKAGVAGGSCCLSRCKKMIVDRIKGSVTLTEGRVGFLKRGLKQRRRRNELECERKRGQGGKGSRVAKAAKT